MFYLPQVQVPKRCVCQIESSFYTPHCKYILKWICNLIKKFCMFFLGPISFMYVGRAQNRRAFELSLQIRFAVFCCTVFIFGILHLTFAYIRQILFMECMYNSPHSECLPVSVYMFLCIARARDMLKYLLASCMFELWMSGIFWHENVNCYSCLLF